MAQQGRLMMSFHPQAHKVEGEVDSHTGSSRLHMHMAACQNSAKDEVKFKNFKSPSADKSTASVLFQRILESVHENPILYRYRNWVEVLLHFSVHRCFHKQLRMESASCMALKYLYINFTEEA